MATCIHSSQSCLPLFYTIPIFPLLIERFFIYVSPFFFAAHGILNFMLRGIYCLRLFIVVYTLIVFKSCCRNCVMNVRQFSLLQLLIWAGYRHLLKSDCLRLFVVV